MKDWSWIADSGIRPEICGNLTFKVKLRKKKLINEEELGGFGAGMGRRFRTFRVPHFPPLLVSYSVLSPSSASFLLYSSRRELVRERLTTGITRTPTTHSGTVTWPPWPLLETRVTHDKRNEEGREPPRDSQFQFNSEPIQINQHSFLSSEETNSVFQ